MGTKTLVVSRVWKYKLVRDCCDSTTVAKDKTVAKSRGLGT
jgi:hypothetical protein